MTSKYKPPPLIKKKERNVEPKPTVGAVDTTDRKSLVLSKTRSDFRTEEFIRAIRQKGYFAIWRKAIRCACFRESTNQVKLSCEKCDGSGFRYIDPHLIQVLMTRMDRKDDVRHGGHFFSGSGRVTTEPQYRLGWRDSIELRDSVITYNEYLKKRNRIGKRAHLADRIDSPRYRVVRPIAMFYETPSGDQVRLEDKEHFTINGNGHVQWTHAGDKLVPDGTIYSFLYETRPVYIVTSHSNILRSTLSLRKRAAPTVEQLPIQVDVMLDYLDDFTDQAAPVTEDGDGI